MAEFTSTDARPEIQADPRRITRFWSFVDQSAGPDGCWLWTGWITDSGYGGFAGSPGQNEPAHRFSYRTFVGPIPAGMVIRHRCDNPLCVNPSHLESGTQKENIADRDQRGRSVYPRGSHNGNSKLTEDQVREIRRMSATMTPTKIARTIGVGRQAVARLLAGKTWSHVV